MLKFLSDVKKLSIEVATYIIEGLKKFSVEEFRKTFDMMLQQERVKHLSSGVSIRGDSLSTLVNIKFIGKLANNSYHSLCTSGALNVPTAILNYCFKCDATDHGVVSFPHKKDQNKTAENNNKFIRMKKSQGGNGGGKTWAKHSNKKGWNNKPQNQQQSNKKANGNGYTKRNNEVHLVDGKFMCL